MTEHQDTTPEKPQETERIDESTTAAVNAADAAGNPHIEALSRGIGPRPAGSSAESDAADYLVAALGEAGLPAARLASHTPRYAGLVELAIAVASLVAVLIAVVVAPLGLLLLLALFGLLLADVFGYVSFSRWLPAGESVNVLTIVPPSNDEIRRLIVTATIDSGKVGLLSRRHWAFAYAWLHVAILLAQVFAIVITIVVLARGDGALNMLFALPALILVATIVLLGEREQRRKYSPGAITNVSGVATLIELAGMTVRRPPSWLEVWFLGIGASNVPGAGIAGFLEKNRFDPDITYFVHLQSPGGGTPSVPKSAGAGLRMTPATPLLTWIMDSVRANGREASVRAHHRLPVATQAHTTHRAGYQSIVVAGVDEQGRIPFLDDLEDLPYQVRAESIVETAQFLSATIDALDREVAARAMLARSTASVQDPTRAPPADQDLPSEAE